MSATSSAAPARAYAIEQRHVGRRRAGEKVRLRQHEWLPRKQRLPHHPLAGNHFLDARLKVVLVNPFRRIGTGFRRGGKRSLQHRVPDVAAAHLVAAGQRLEIDVGRERRPRRMQLHAPNLRAFGLPRHLEQDVCPDASLECRIEVRREVRGEDHHAVVPLELLQQHADDGVRFALKPVID